MTDQDKQRLLDLVAKWRKQIEDSPDWAMEPAEAAGIGGCADELEEVVNG